MSFLPKLQLPIFHRSARPNVSRQMSMSLTNKGLLNPSGHNNCFLNSCVQVLWHVDVFRRSFREFKGHACVGHSCIFCALQSLFTQFQHSSQSALPPDDLRQALARCYQEQHRFQLGIMDDAAECFEKILEQIHFHLTGSDDLDSCSAPHCLAHQKCALNVLEMTECACGETSEPLAFVQFIHYISAPSLGAAAKKRKQEASYPLGDGGVFGALVKSVSEKGEWRECATCHRLTPMKKMLLNSPDVVCIGMIWDSDQPSVDDIMSVVESVGTILRVSDIFHRVMSDASSMEYWLCGMVAYYGHHYCTFCYHTVLRQWGFFDDANFRTVSSNWSDVVELCRKAHYQPLLLVYTNPFAEKITMTTAPTEVTKVIATDTKTKSLASVTEENETKNDETKKKNNQTSTNEAQVQTSVKSRTLPHPQGSGGTATNASGDRGKTLPSSSKAQSDKTSSSAAASKQGEEYEIDPLTLSVRPVATSGRQSTGIYPRLSDMREGGEGGEGGGRKEGESWNTRPSAPPLLPYSASSTSNSARSAPAVFQSTPHTSRPAPVTNATPSFPVHFQPSPSPHPHHPSPSPYPHYPSPSAHPHHPSPSPHPRHPSPQPQVLQPPYSPSRLGYPQPHTLHTRPPPNQPYYQAPHRGPYPSNASPYAGGYPPATRYRQTNRPPTQPHPPTGVGHVYTNSTQPASPWRGVAAVSSGFQPQVQAEPQTFLHQSSPQASPRSSPSLSKMLTPQPSPATSTSAAASAPTEPSSYSSQTPSPMIARPRPSPPRSVPSPNQGDKTRSAPSPSATSTPGGGSSDNLIEFSVSPATLLTATKSNRPPIPQGHTTPPNTTRGSSNLSPTSSNSSREVSPYQSGSGASTTSLEGDLIQWSLTPDMIQRVQKYRGRQGIRQGSADSLNLSLRSAGPQLVTDDVTGREEGGGRESVGVGVASQSVENQSDRFSKQVPPSATPTSVGPLLVDVRESTGKSRKGAEREPNIVNNTVAGQEGQQGQGSESCLPPDPLYTDPDVVQTMMRSIAEQRGRDQQHEADITNPLQRRTPEPSPPQPERPGLGEDPLYAVPEQVVARMRAKKSLSAAQPSDVGKEAVTPPTTTPSDIPVSVQPVLQEALAAWRKAESKRDSDITVARMNYSRAATLLMKVLLDPAVANDQTLYHNISHKRTEALTKCSEMNDRPLTQGIKQSSVYSSDGVCSQCGKRRQLNSQTMCGPCHLKDKISQTR